MGIFSKELGHLHVAVRTADNHAEWQYKIAENYDDPLQFCIHFAFVFDYYTFFCDREMYAVDTHTQFKPHMRAVLVDARLPLFFASIGAYDGRSEFFEVGRQVHADLSDPPEFVHDSRLTSQFGRYRLTSTRYESPSWPNGGPRRHGVAFALLNHLVRKCGRAASTKPEVARKALLILAVVDSAYEHAGAWGSLGVMDAKAIGWAPAKAIKYVEGLSDLEAKSVVAEMFSKVSEVKR